VLNDVSGFAFNRPLLRPQNKAKYRKPIMFMIFLMMNIQLSAKKYY